MKADKTSLFYFFKVLFWAWRDGLAVYNIAAFSCDTSSVLAPIPCG